MNRLPLLLLLLLLALPVKARTTGQHLSSESLADCHTVKIEAER